jgi:hypothetical protein
MKTIKLTISIITFVAGIFLLINSQSNITGAVIGISGSVNSILNSFLGILFIVSSIVLFATTHSELEKITLSSSIKKSPPLLRLTQDAVRNQTVERELNHLIKELSKGNFEAGLGHPGHISGTDVYYLRGRNGARLYYHKIGEHNYEIVAKSAKGRNQDQVIDKIEKAYGN